MKVHTHKISGDLIWQVMICFDSTGTIIVLILNKFCIIRSVKLQAKHVHFDFFTALEMEILETLIVILRLLQIQPQDIYT